MQPFMTTIEESAPSLKPASVVVIGTVALDLLNFWDESHTASSGVRVEIGGVCKHVACVLGNLGAAPRFVTTRFPGELGGMLADRLTANQVDWQPLPIVAPFSLFQAHLDPLDHVFAESFVEGESIAALTPESLTAHPALIDAQIIVTCTNLSVSTIDALAAIAHRQGSQLWLLVSSAADVRRVAQLAQPPDMLSLNLDELRILTGDPGLTEVADLGRAGQKTAAPSGHCLITLGRRGSLLCAPDEPRALYQPVAPIQGRSPVGSGDVLFASVLADRLRGADWPMALAFAAICTRRYLLRDPADPQPYRALIDPVTPSDWLTLPAIERISLDHGR